MIVKLILCVLRTCQSTKEDILDLFIPHHNVYIHEIMDQRVDIFYRNRKNKVLISLFFSVQKFCISFLGQ